MAKYRRPIVPDPIAFETTSTIPAAASFQDVPPPSQETKSVRKAIPIPAMTPTYDPVDVSKKEIEKNKEKEIFVQGVVIPPRPVPPKDDGESYLLLQLTSLKLILECCMNSCVNCVYNLYADDLEAYTSALDEAHIALRKAGVIKSEWPEAVRKLDAKVNGKEGPKREEESKAMEGVDPVTLAFLEMEKKLKKKQKAKGV